jgi:transcriptional regulator with XRE-family HTH domain
MVQPSGEAKQRLGRMLRQARENKGLSVTDVARAVGASRFSVYNWEKGDAWPDSGTLLRLATLFHVRVEDLVGDGPAPRPTSAFLSAMGQQVEAFIESEVERRLRDKIDALDLTPQQRTRMLADLVLGAVAEDKRVGAADAEKVRTAVDSPDEGHAPPRQLADRRRGTHGK